MREGVKYTYFLRKNRKISMNFSRFRTFCFKSELIKFHRSESELGKNSELVPLHMLMPLFWSSTRPFQPLPLILPAFSWPYGTGPYPFSSTLFLSVTSCFWFFHPCPRPIFSMSQHLFSAPFPTLAPLLTFSNPDTALQRTFPLCLFPALSQIQNRTLPLSKTLPPHMSFHCPCRSPVLPFPASSCHILYCALKWIQ